MKTKTVYRFDKDGVYTGTAESYESPLEEGVFSLPANCTWEEPIETKEPFVPVWNGTEWIAVEDHRKHLNEKGNYEGGTPYWLPEDNWDFEPRYMTELGPLPSDALLERPEKPQKLIEKENLEKELMEAKAYLEATDYVTLKIIEEPDTQSQYVEVLAKRKEMRAKIDPLQARITALSI